jgi:hypothetical protein
MVGSRPHYVIAYGGNVSRDCHSTTTSKFESFEDSVLFYLGIFGNNKTLLSAAVVIRTCLITGPPDNWTS